MPPSYTVSRVALLALVIAVATVLILVGLDSSTWARFTEQLQTTWATVRTAVQGDGSASTALGRG